MADQTFAPEPLTPEQDAYLNCLHNGNGDWALDAAKQHLLYLGKCKSLGEEIEYLSAALRLTEAQGAERASRECMTAIASLTKKTP